MTDVRVRVVGDRELSRSLTAAARDLDDLSDADRAAGDHATGMARLRAPRESGRLATGTHATVIAGGGFYIKSDVEHFWPVHSGTPTRAANPYAGLAIAADERAIVGIYTDHVDEVVEDINRSA